MEEKERSLKKHKRIRCFLTGSIILVLFLLIGVLVFMGNEYSKIVMSKMKVASFTPVEVAITPEVTEKIKEYTINKSDKKITNILLIGIDSDLNIGAPQRSDSMTIVSLDGIHGSIKLTSLMRDTFVNIDGHGKDKLNHSFAYGGPKLLLRTINQNFDLDIQDYVLVNFNDLIHIIDAIGGVDLYVTWEEAMYMNFAIENINELNDSNIKKLDIKSQNIRVNGAQALSYARIRYLDTDYRRSQRQRLLLLKVYERILETPLLQLPETIVQLSAYAKVSLSEMEILDLTSQVMSRDFGIHGLHFPTYQTSHESTKGSWHIVFDRDDTITELHEWIFQDIDPYRQMTLTEIEKEKNNSTTVGEEETLKPDSTDTNNQHNE